MGDIRDAVKKVWEHEKRLEGFDLNQILKKINELKEEIDKNEKALKKFEHSVIKDIQMLKDWCARLE